MKNVKHVKKQEHKQQSFNKAEPLWVEEWVPLDNIVRHRPLQVRSKLNAGAVKRYQDMTAAGSEPPPIKVGRVGSRLYLVDGWHRIEAGALQTASGMHSKVLALVADMSEKQVRWEAARANIGHGVPLRKSELREVFRAFIRAQMHHLAKGKYMSYRDMGAALGMNFSTLRNWTQKDFPSLFRALGQGGQENNAGGLQPIEGLTMEQEHASEAQAALQALVQHAMALSAPENRWELLKGLEEASEALKKAGVVEPRPEEF